MPYYNCIPKITLNHHNFCVRMDGEVVQCNPHGPSELQGECRKTQEGFRTGCNDFIWMDSLSTTIDPMHYFWFIYSSSLVKIKWLLAHWKTASIPLPTSSSGLSEVEYLNRNVDGNLIWETRWVNFATEKFPTELWHFTGQKWSSSCSLQSSPSVACKQEEVHDDPWFLQCLSLEATISKQLWHGKLIGSQISWGSRPRNVESYAFSLCFKCCTFVSDCKQTRASPPGSYS